MASAVRGSSAFLLRKTQTANRQRQAGPGGLGAAVCFVSVHTAYTIRFISGVRSNEPHTTERDIYCAIVKGLSSLEARDSVTILNS
jgi:hypothetical protein